MAIEIIGKLKQKNNGTFKLMDLKDVDYDGNGKSAKEVIDGLGCNLGINSEDKKLYLIDKDGNKVGDGIDVDVATRFTFEDLQD